MRIESATAIRRRQAIRGNATTIPFSVARRDWYHAVHEAAHAIVGFVMGLTTKFMVAKSPGKTAHIEFCSFSALNRDSTRWLMIAVAGQVGTRVVGFKNRLISGQLARLGEDAPGCGSDAEKVWERWYPHDEIKAAEKSVRLILSKRLPALERLAKALLKDRRLTTEQICRLIRNP